MILIYLDDFEWVDQFTAEVQRSKLEILQPLTQSPPTFTMSPCHHDDFNRFPTECHNIMPWCLTAGDHGDLIDGIVMRQQRTHDGVARFVVGDELLRSVVLQG